MGGSDWARATAKVKQAVRDMAGELVRLYTVRLSVPGHAFGAETTVAAGARGRLPARGDQRPDLGDRRGQGRHDLPEPMDRLVCGDVGFGKTEIAVRAAFKAVMEGKQVAVLVPTTLLAEQHFITFDERFAPFPVTVKMLSRFVSHAEQKQVVEDVKAGKVDVVIGTHRLLGKDVAFRDLGLLVVDEEQRFGVAHKERLKQFRASVDVLTMTATPIPHARDGAHRHPRDEHGRHAAGGPPAGAHVRRRSYDEGLALGAVRRELLREESRSSGCTTGWRRSTGRSRGSSRSSPSRASSSRTARWTRRCSRAADDDVLEPEADVLVSTVIIESGLDVPNANTLVVDRADALGLAQMYQLRGRVGRSTERAFAYFFFPAPA